MPSVPAIHLRFEPSVVLACCKRPKAERMSASMMRRTLLMVFTSHMYSLKSVGEVMMLYNIIRVALLADAPEAGGWLDVFLHAPCAFEAGGYEMHGDEVTDGELLDELAGTTGVAIAYAAVDGEHYKVEIGFSSDHGLSPRPLRLERVPRFRGAEIQ